MDVISLALKPGGEISVRGGERSPRLTKGDGNQDSCPLPLLPSGQMCKVWAVFHPSPRAALCPAARQGEGAGGKGGRDERAQQQHRCWKQN